MFECVRLEWRKSRLLFMGVAGTFLASLPLTALVSRFSGYPVPAGISAALFFWNLAGLPLLAVLFGSSTGALLRSQAIQEAEALLPMSPGRRAGGALLASLTQLFLLALLVLLTAFLLSPTWRELLVAPDQSVTSWKTVKSLNPLLRPLFWLNFFTMSYALLVSFICAFAFRQGILGAFVGVLLAGLAAGALGLGFALQSLFGFRAPFTAKAALAMLAALLGTIWVVADAVPWLERRTCGGWARALALAAGLCAGAMAALSAWGWTQHRLAKSLAFDLPRKFSWGCVVNDSAALPWKQVTRRGTLLQSLESELVWVTPEGKRRTLIPGQNLNLAQLLLPHYIWRMSVLTAWDKDGTLWVARWDYPNRTSELWHGRLEQGLSLHTRFTDQLHPMQLLWRGREMGMLAWSRGTHELLQYAPIPQAGQKPQWTPAGEDTREFVLKSWIESGQAAELSHDLRTLTHRVPGAATQRWSLPGKTLSSQVMDLRTVHLADGSTVFLIPVQLRPGRRALAVCLPDGSVRQEWSGNDKVDYDLNIQAGGMVWGWRYLKAMSTLHIMLPDGRFLPPVEVGRALAQARGKDTAVWYGPTILVHADSSKLWLVEGRRLAVLDHVGKLLEWHRIPDSKDMCQACEDHIRVAEGGFFLHNGRRLYFIRWDGSRRDLGPA